MESRSTQEFVKTKTTLILALIILSIVSSFTLFGQGQEIVLPNATPKLPKDSSEVFNHVDLMALLIQ